jgi:hypothetical protein
MSKEKENDGEQRIGEDVHDSSRAPDESGRSREKKKQGLSEKQLRAYECIDNLFMLNKIQGAILTQLEKEIL